jgi:uncharacterized membrane protein YeaQ/YmgE (transglycosylase-associated protein family)
MKPDILGQKLQAGITGSTGFGGASGQVQRQEVTNMSWIITILVGALCGWLASIIMKTDAQQGAIANILIGIVGSILAQWIFGSLLHIGSSTVAGNGFSFWSIIWGIIGSVVLIAILKALKVLR